MLEQWRTVRAAGLGAAVLGLLLTASAGDPPRFDFEESGLSLRWSASGEIEVSRDPLPVRPAEGDSGPKGHAAHLVAGKGGFFYTKPGLFPADWGEWEELHLWVYRSPEEARLRAVSVIEAQILEDADSCFWRKVELDHEGWRRVDLPLRRMGWRKVRIPSWQRVWRIGFYFRDAADIWIDAIEVVDERRGPGTILAGEELSELAFPEAGAGAVRLRKSGGVELLTDCEELDVRELHRHLRGLLKDVRAMLPKDGATLRTPTLVVFAKDEDYRAFAPRLAASFGRKSDPPRSDGYTLLTVGQSSWSAEHGSLRPSYTHEFVHSALSCLARMPNNGEWFQEGLATHFQLDRHPQADVAEIITKDIERESHHDPLPELCGGTSIRTDRYWQAMTVVQTLMESERYSDSFGRLVAAMVASGSTDLGPHLEPVLATSWQELEREWRALCRERYAD